MKASCCLSGQVTFYLECQKHRRDRKAWCLHLPRRFLCFPCFFAFFRVSRVFSVFFRVVSPPPSSTPFAEQFANSTRLLFNISSYVLSLCPLSSISLFHNICLSLNQSLDSYWTIPRHPISIKLCSIPSHQLVSCHSPFFSFSPFSFTAIHSLELYSFLYSFRPWCRFECLSLSSTLSVYLSSLLCLSLLFSLSLSYSLCLSLPYSLCPSPILSLSFSFHILIGFSHPYWSFPRRPIVFECSDSCQTQGCISRACWQHTWALGTWWNQTCRGRDSLSIRHVLRCCVCVYCKREFVCERETERVEIGRKGEKECDTSTKNTFAVLCSMLSDKLICHYLTLLCVRER